MNYGYIILIISGGILILSIININIGPIVSLTIGFDWGNLNCEILSDEYDFYKNDIPNMDDDIKKYYYEIPIEKCRRRKAMHNMEYTAFVFDISIGFICGSLSLLQSLGDKTELVPKLAIISFGCGITGFILNFVYIIYNGLVYTTDYYIINEVDYSFEIGIYKRDIDGSFAELVGSGTYKCLYYDGPENYHELFATYSEYHKKQYNYDKDLYFDYKNNNQISECTKEDYFPYCYYDQGYINEPTYNTYESFTYSDNKGVHQCPKLYLLPYDTNVLKNISDKFLATLILSLFICLGNIGLVIMGFLLM
jgi:hypothetical protein